METRICKYCHEEKSIDDFETANIIKGKVYKRWRCHSCYMKSKRDRKIKIKEWFNDIKKTFKCKKCGENKYYMLDLHHRNPDDKDVNLADAIRSGWSKKRILKELEKCDVYCANHHRELHWREK